MGLLANLKPKFWEHVDVSARPHKYLFNFRRVWKATVMLTLVVALVPLVILAVIDYQVSLEAMESDILLRTARLVSITKQNVSYFVAERRAALDFVSQNDPIESLATQQRLDSLLKNLKNSFGGFIDLGLINDQGFQITYSGPHELQGRQYATANWFMEVSRNGVYLSDVYMGYRNMPHMIIAVKHDLPEGGFYVLRAALDTAKFNDIFTALDMSGEGDAFVVNREGILQTPSRHHGNVLERIDLDVPAYSEKTQVLEVRNQHNGPLVIGYAHVTDTPFVLMIVKHKDRLMAQWEKGRLQVLGFLLFSLVAIVVVVLGGITYLVNQIYLADQRRLTVMHQAEYANKMASLGRLSAGVAHEINNPLAIINEKAGLIKDLFTFRSEYAADPKLIQLIDSIISSVERCAGITRRLLNFARSAESTVKDVKLKETIQEVLGFVGKEAEYRCIAVELEVDETIGTIKSDPGRLQEIFLNLITNAFAAVKDGGHLRIRVNPTGRDMVAVRFSDDGQGIPSADLDRVFEPFFSTRVGKGGTGLGLSITYGLVQELGGRIEVESKVGVGTTFIVKLPLVSPRPAGERKVADGTTQQKGQAEA